MAGFNMARFETLPGLPARLRLTCVVDGGANPLDHPPYGARLRMGGCEIWGGEPLKHLAVLADAVCASFNLAAAQADALAERGDEDRTAAQDYALQLAATVGKGRA